MAPHIVVPSSPFSVCGVVFPYARNSKQTLLTGVFLMWDAVEPGVQVDKNATEAEIKKAYRKLQT